MENVNFAVVAGNLTRDPDLRETAGGTYVLNCGIAVNGSRKAPNGDWEDYPNFFDFTIWGARAEKLSRILHKGMKVTLAGKLHYSSWEKDGQKRSKVEIYVDSVELPPRQEQQRAGGDDRPGRNYNQRQFEGSARTTGTASSYDEDIPF